MQVRVSSPLLLVESKPPLYSLKKFNNISRSYLIHRVTLTWWHGIVRPQVLFMSLRQKGLQIIIAVQQKFREPMSDWSSFKVVVCLKRICEVLHLILSNFSCGMRTIILLVSNSIPRKTMTFDGPSDFSSARGTLNSFITDLKVSIMLWQLWLSSSPPRKSSR